MQFYFVFQDYILESILVLDTRRAQVCCISNSYQGKIDGSRKKSFSWVAKLDYVGGVFYLPGTC
jgi:hypothetical protein